MSTIATIDAVRREPTLDSAWQEVAGAPIGDELLEWPPDLFALTEVMLERSEAYRFALSPPAGSNWPPAHFPGWPEAVVEAGELWSAWAEDRSGAIPQLLVSEWEILRGGAGIELSELTEARNWRLCEAVLTLHAIADEACAGLGVALDSSDGRGYAYRARGRELLARTGTLARFPSRLIRVLPKLHTPANGTSLRSLSRYASLHGPGVDVRWHKVRGRGLGADVNTTTALLLPWPLRVRGSDFRPLPGSVGTDSKEPAGFFEFAPSEDLDLNLVDRMLISARDEAGTVNVVILPESAVEERAIDALEALLSRHGVTGLITGVREQSAPGREFPCNWVHIGISTGEGWVHVRQSKHNRWSLDAGQIDQYHLGGTLHPHIRWSEAMKVPRRSVQFVDIGDGATLVSLVCEDIAQIDDVANLIRSVGPMIVVTPLLDGPQLNSRWAARYASVMADNPGSAVLTLTSFGMAQRSRPAGRSPSAIIALWKDSVRGTREIPLEPGAQGVLLSASADRATRRSFDGRRPVDNDTEFFNVSVYQVRAANAGSDPVGSSADPPSMPVLGGEDLTILTSWAEALAEGMTSERERLAAAVADAQAAAPWRAELGLPEPSPRLAEAISCMIHDVEVAVAVADDGEPLDALLPVVGYTQPGNGALGRLARRLLRSALEQRLTLQQHQIR